MKKYLFILAFTFLAVSVSTAQSTMDAARYSQLKKLGKIPAENNYTILPDSAVTYTPSLLNGAQSSRSGADCGCYIEPDNTYTLAMTPNDDGSSALINLPFNFCFYGTTQNSVYINNNGNISFGQTYSAFTSAPFPSNQFVMVAPFFGDVDTRLSNGISGGEVWYKVTPTALIVNWVDVGYYATSIDKRNTFQLIITNGSDPLVPNGNVAFCYKDMQWTTGSASGGTNGFGGTPSTVGANLGNGVDFIQFGRFDTAGTAYDGPFGNNDGVSWLDDQSFYFNACSSNNTPPITTGLNSCDTIGVCRDDTLYFDLSFIAPEQNQTTNINVVSSFPGLVINSITPGVSATLDAYVVGGLNNVGYHNLQIEAYDNGTPAETTYVDLVIFVDSTLLNPVITSSDSTLCVGDSTTLDVGSGYDSYLWNTGDTGVSTITAFSGVYSVLVRKGFCEKATASYDVVTIIPQPQITDSVLCENDSLLLTTTTPYDSVFWSTGDTLDSIWIDTIGVYSVAAHEFGCVGYDTVTVTSVPAPVPTITGDTFACHQDSVWLTTQNWPQLQWSNGTLNYLTLVPPGDYDVTVTDTNGCSATTAIHTVLSVVPAVTILGDSLLCDTQTTNLTAVPTYYQSYLWSTGDTVTQIPGIPGMYTLFVTDSLGCVDSAYIHVQRFDNPTANFEVQPGFQLLADQTANFMDLSTIDSGSIDFWSWNFAGLATDTVQNPTFVFTEAGIYPVSLHVSNLGGCWDSIQQMVTVITEIEGPNIITPNGDYVNDYLIFPSVEYYDNVHLQIFNRWGTLLYDDPQYKNSWDAHLVPDGVYYYVLEIPSIPQTVKGSFTILRNTK